MINNNRLSLKKNWSLAFASDAYRKYLYISMGSISIILAFFPWFFQTIEAIGHFLCLAFAQINSGTGSRKFV